MPRQLTVVQPVPSGDHGPCFRASPDGWLPAPRAAGPGRWRIDLYAGGVRRPVVCDVGDPWTTHRGVQRRLRWRPVGQQTDVVPVERLLPAFDGELYLVGGTATPSLALAGDVDVPLGRLGEAVDALVLGRVAHRTAARFLADVAARLAAAATGDQPVGSGTHHRS